MIPERKKIMMNKFFGTFLFMLVILSPNARAQDSPFELLSNDLIWYSGEFRSEYVSGVRSMNDGKHYTSLERTNEGSAIVKYAYRSGNCLLYTSDAVDE